MCLCRDLEAFSDIVLIDLTYSIHGMTVFKLLRMAYLNWNTLYTGVVKLKLTNVIDRKTLIIECMRQR